MAKQPEEKILYQVAILRTDGQHISAMESLKFEECYEKWKTLHTKWTESVKETKPFVLEDPIITAFNPALIFEITLRPVMHEAENVNSNNPYRKAMMERGLSSTLQGHDLLNPTRPY